MRWVCAGSECGRGAYVPPPRLPRSGAQARSRRRGSTRPEPPAAHHLAAPPTPDVAPDRTLDDLSPPERTSLWLADGWAERTGVGAREGGGLAATRPCAGRAGTWDDGGLDWPGRYVAHISPFGAEVRRPRGLPALTAPSDTALSLDQMLVSLRASPSSPGSSGDVFASLRTPFRRTAEQHLRHSLTDIFGFDSADLLKSERQQTDCLQRAAVSLRVRCEGDDAEAQRDLERMNSACDALQWI